MPLKVKSEPRRPGVMVISPIGAIDGSTYTILENKVEERGNVIIECNQLVELICLLNRTMVSLLEENKSKNHRKIVEFQKEQNRLADCKD